MRSPHQRLRRQSKRCKYNWLYDRPGKRGVCCQLKLDRVCKHLTFDGKCGRDCLYSLVPVQIWNVSDSSSINHKIWHSWDKLLGLCNHGFKLWCFDNLRHRLFFPILRHIWSCYFRQHVHLGMDCLQRWSNSRNCLPYFNVP